MNGGVWGWVGGGGGVKLIGSLCYMKRDHRGWGKEWEPQQERERKKRKVK